MSVRTYRPSSCRHLDCHASEQYRCEAGAWTNVIVPESVLTVHQQLTAVVVVIVRQLHPK